MHAYSLFNIALLLCLTWQSASGADVSKADIGAKGYVVDVLDRLRIVDLRDASFAEKFSAQVCIGLLSRSPVTTGKAYGYAVFAENDVTWFRDLTGVDNVWQFNTSVELLVNRDCIQSKVTKGFILYNATAHKTLLPNIITLAAVTDAIPLEVSQKGLLPGLPVFDIEKQWAGFSTLKATSWLYERYINSTSNLAKINPGYKSRSIIGNIREELDEKRTMKLTLIDYLTKERMFTIFLPLGCIPLTAEHRLFEKIVNSNQWKRPIKVFGYDDTWAIAGDLFEAETFCSKEHNLGQIATTEVNNLAFFSLSEPIKSPLPVNAYHKANSNYNPEYTYVSLVLGDGDNIDYVKRFMPAEMKHRLKSCSIDPKLCFPLLWTMSSHLLKLAPGMLRWYYDQAVKTGADYFMLPPSGELYAYPAAMPKKAQASFVKETEDSCLLLNTNATMDWEWFFSWGRDIDEYLPLYAKNNIVRGVFAVNVPYLFPIVAYRGKYKVEQDKVVLFKPVADWQRTHPGKPALPLDFKDNLTPAQMAVKLGRMKRGTVTYIYLTHDNGARINDFEYLVGNLTDHVKIVDANTLVDMAIAAEHHRTGKIVRGEAAKLLRLK